MRSDDRIFLFRIQPSRFGGQMVLEHENANEYNEMEESLKKLQCMKVREDDLRDSQETKTY